MRRRIKITNDFHNTETFVFAEQKEAGCYKINLRQYREMRKRLCGMPECKCSVNSEGYIIEDNQDYALIMTREYVFPGVD